MVKVWLASTKANEGKNSQGRRTDAESTPKLTRPTPNRRRIDAEPMQTLTRPTAIQRRTDAKRNGQGEHVVGQTESIRGRQQAMGGGVRRAKKASIHVKSHISNRPKFCHPCFFKNPRPTRGPSPMELALGISAASRCWFVYYTFFKSVEHNDKRHSVPGRLLKEL